MAGLLVSVINYQTSIVQKDGSLKSSSCIKSLKKNSIGNRDFFCFNDLIVFGLLQNTNLEYQLKWKLAKGNGYRLKVNYTSSINTDMN